MLLNRQEFVIFMQSRVPLGPDKFYVVVLVYFKGHLRRSGEGRRVHCHPVQVVVRVITTDN